MTTPEVHLVAGTCEEAVKLATVAVALRDAGLLTPIIVTTGRHPAMVDRALAAFGLEPDLALPGDLGTGTPDDLLTEMIRRLDELWAARTPAAVIAQGDTATSLAGTLAAAWRQIPVVHLDAGVRSGDLDSSFPEEANRRLIAQLATLHMTPTPLAAMNLLDENVAAADVLLTGNTIVDAMLALAGRRPPFENAEVAAARATVDGRRLVVVTVSRCEPSDRIRAAVDRLIDRYADIDVILACHPDPSVRAPVETAERVTITGPLPYPDLARLLAEATLLLTDSGDIQEAAPSFGVPTLVLRDVTESAELPRARLVGTDTDPIVQAASALLDSQVRRDAMVAGGNPYGDGLAARRAAQATAALLGLAEHPEPMPSPEFPATVPVDSQRPMHRPEVP